MAITTADPKAQELLKLLQEKFGVHKQVTKVVVTLELDHVVVIEQTYHPEADK